MKKFVIPNNIKAFIFDMDGTVIDSMWMWKEIDREYLARHGHDLPEDLQKNIAGFSFDETAHYFKNTFGITDEIKKIQQDWNDMARDKYENSVPVKNGVREFIIKARELGIRTGIATSNSPELTEVVLKSLGIGELFDEVHTTCEVAKGKPSPDIFLLVAEKLGVAPCDCIVFEDLPEGLRGAEKAGMLKVAVEDDFSAGSRKEKIELSDMYIEDYGSILLIREE